MSENFDTPVIYRLSTRVSHSQSIVELSERQEVEVKPYTADIAKICYDARQCDKNIPRLKIE